MPQKTNKFLAQFSDFQKAMAIVVFIVVTTTGTLTYLYTNFASAEDVKQIQQSVSYMQLEFQLSSKQERLFKIADRFECEDYTFKACGLTIPKTVKEEITRLQKEIKDIESRIERLETN